jgi:putative transposase
LLAAQRLTKDLIRYAVTEGAATRAGRASPTAAWLSATLFASFARVREALAIWKDDYNIIRPLSALGSFAKLSASAMQRDGALRYIEGSARRPLAQPGRQASNEARTLLIDG